MQVFNLSQHLGQKKLSAAPAIKKLKNMIHTTHFKFMSRVYLIKTLKASNMYIEEVQCVDNRHISLFQS